MTEINSGTKGGSVSSPQSRATLPLPAEVRPASVQEGSPVFRPSADICPMSSHSMAMGAIAPTFAMVAAVSSKDMGITSDAPPTHFLPGLLLIGTAHISSSTTDAAYLIPHVYPDIHNMHNPSCPTAIGAPQAQPGIVNPHSMFPGMNSKSQTSYLWKDWPPDIAHLCQGRSNLEMAAMAQDKKYNGSSLDERLIETTLEASAYEGAVNNVYNDLILETSGEETLVDLSADPNLTSIDNFIYRLQQCREKKDLVAAKCLHTQLCEVGLERHKVVGNYVVPMFIDCGSLPDALQIFNLLLYRNEISWTSLIKGYVHCGHPRDAFDIFEQMQHDNVHPKSYTLVAALQACAASKNTEGGLKIHAEALANGYLGDGFVGNSLINMYAQCGSLLQAGEVFSKLPVRDVVSWTSLMAGFVQHGLDQDALDCHNQMQLVGVSPCEFTFVCSLKACSNLGAIKKGQELHVEATQKGFDQCPHVGNTLIHLYGTCGSPEEAHLVFNHMLVRDVVSWTAVITGYAERGPWMEALKLYDQMQLEGVHPNSVTFASAIKACGSTGAEDRGHEIHTQVALRGLEGDTMVGNSLVAMYAKCFAFSEAEQVSNKLPVRDAVSGTALIAGYTDCGDGLQALNSFEQMQLQGIPGDAFTFSCILKACSIIQALDKGRKIHSSILEIGLEKDGPICNALIDMYTKCGSPLEAQVVFDKLQCRTVVSWTSLIMGYAEHGIWQEVFRCFEQMQVDGVSPNTVTLSCVLRACGSMGAIEKGRAIHTEFATDFIDMIPSVTNSLMNMYAKCGSLKEARDIFDKLPARDVTAYSVMIRGYGVNCEARKAVECFEEMLRQGVRPDSVTFTCLLTACCHGRLVREGHDLFRRMREDHEIEPTLEHYVSVVGLFAKSGHLHEAERFLEMLSLSYERTWAALLSACKIFGDEELASRSFQQLVMSNPHAPAWSVLMADVLAGVSKWDAACRLEDLRKHAGLFKEPANALIEIDSQIHEFIAGNSPSMEVSEMVSSLNSRVKKEGHLPNVESVVKPASDKEREVGLCKHAEKLALAFGLIHTPQGQTLRVTKSMRVCNDCHDASKIVSHMEKREIILRDDCTIHHFKDGSCSCGDLF